MPRLTLLCLLALALQLVGLGEASAHTGPVEPTALRARSGNPEQLLLATTFGLLTRDGADAGWEAICSEAVGYDEAFNPVVHWASDGALFAGSLRGLFVSRDDGCTWTSVPTFADRGATDVRTAPDDPDALFVTTGKYGASNGLFRSPDGENFTATALVGDEALFTAIRFAPSNPDLVYVSAWWFSPANTAALFRSTDRAQTFEEIAPATPAASGFTVLGIAPNDPQVLLAGAHDGTAYVLLKSTDGGARFTVVAEDDREFRDVVFSADGARIWAASGTRLYHSADGSTFSRVHPPQRAGCAAEIGETVYVCGSTFQDGWALATLDGGSAADPDGGVPLSPVFSFSEMKRRQCPAGTPTEDVCAPLWVPLASLVGADPGELPPVQRPDAGSNPADAGAGDGGVAPDSDPSAPPVGCGCGGTGGAAIPGAMLVWLVLSRAVRKKRAAALALIGSTLACGPAPVGTFDGPDASVAPTNPCSPNPCLDPNRSVCVEIEDGTRCDCDPGHVLVEGRCEPERPVDCTSQHAEGDAFEPDGCPALARDIGGTGAQKEAHTLSPLGDVDWFRLDPAAGRAYRFELEAEGGGVRLDLYRGESLDPLGAYSAPDGRLDVVIRAASDARILAQVRGSAHEGASGYAISIADLGPDDHGGTPEEASVVAPGESNTAIRERSGDVDALRFSAVSGNIYRVEATRVDAAECLLELLAPSGATVAADLDGADADLRLEVQESGEFTALVSGTGTGACSIRVEALGLDDHGDDLTAASEVVPVPIASGSAAIETPGDRDVLWFLADVDHVYRIACTPLSLAGCDIRVMTASGLPVSSDLDGGAGQVLYEFNGGGIFYVELAGHGAGIGTFEWRIEDLWHDDHGDDVFTATPMLANGAWVNGNLETPTDRDHLSFEATAGRVYRITCARVALPHCELRLYDASEALLGTDADGGDAVILHEASFGARLSVEVRSGTGVHGTYLLKVEDQGTDDVGDTPSSASPIATNGAPTLARFETPDDVDWFRFFTPSGQALELLGSGVPVQVTLLAPDGTTVVLSGGLPGVFTPSVTGTYFLGAEPFSAGAAGEYTLTVRPH